MKTDPTSAWQLPFAGLVLLLFALFVALWSKARSEMAQRENRPLNRARSAPSPPASPLAKAIEELGQLEWKGQEASQRLALNPIPSGLSIQLLEAFEPRSAQPDGRLEPFLDRLGRLLEREGGWIEILGHADPSEERSAEAFSSNWDLSHARARALGRHWLERLPGLRDRLHLSARSHLEPLDPRPLPKARARNRRVEIRVISR